MRVVRWPTARTGSATVPTRAGRARPGRGRGLRATRLVGGARRDPRAGRRNPAGHQHGRLAAGHRQDPHRRRDRPLAAAKLAEAMGIDAARFVARVEGAGPRAFVEARILRQHDPAEPGAGHARRSVDRRAGDHHHLPAGAHVVVRPPAPGRGRGGDRRAGRRVLGHDPRRRPGRARRAAGGPQPRARGADRVRHRAGGPRQQGRRAVPGRADERHRRQHHPRRRPAAAGRTDPGRRRARRARWWRCGPPTGRSWRRRRARLAGAVHRHPGAVRARFDVQGRDVAGDAARRLDARHARATAPTARSSTATGSTTGRATRRPRSVRCRCTPRSPTRATARSSTPATRSPRPTSRTPPARSASPPSPTWSSAASSARCPRRAAAPSTPPPMIGQGKVLACPLGMGTVVASVAAGHTVIAGAGSRGSDAPCRRAGADRRRGVR